MPPKATRKKAPDGGGSLQAPSQMSRRGPTEAEIVEALTAYKKHIAEHNKKSFEILVHLAETAEQPEDSAYNEEEAAQVRLEFILNELCIHKPDALPADDARRLITAPRDVLAHWNKLVSVPELALDGARGVSRLRGGGGGGAGSPRPPRTVLCEQYRAWIEAALDRIPNPPLFPADFAMLMNHVDGLDGPGWPLYRVHGSGVPRFWDGLGETQTEVMNRVYTDGDKFNEEILEDADWDVRCAWLTGAVESSLCFAIWCRHAKDWRLWNWRYVIRFNLRNYFFDNVVELLGFYKTFNEAKLEDVEGHDEVFPEQL